MQYTEFRVGRVLADSFRVWGKNVGLILATTLLFHIPVMLYGAVAVSDGYITAGTDTGLDLLGFACSFLAQIGLTFIAVEARRGRRPAFAGVVRTVGSRFFSVLGAFIIWFLVMAGIALVAVALTMVMSFVGTIIAGALALVLYFNYWVYVPVAVVERPGAIESLNRSKDLMIGHKLKAFAIVLALGAAIIALGAVFGYLWVAQGWANITVYVGASIGIDVVTNSVMATVIAVAYTSRSSV